MLNSIIFNAKLKPTNIAHRSKTKRHHRIDPLHVPHFFTISILQLSYNKKHYLSLLCERISIKSGKQVFLHNKDWLRWRSRSHWQVIYMEIFCKEISQMWQFFILVYANITSTWKKLKSASAEFLNTLGFLPVQEPIQASQYLICLPSD